MKLKKKILFIMFFVFSFNLFAKEKEKEEEKEEALPSSVALLTGAATGEKRKIPFGGFIVFETGVGLGSFVVDKYARNPYLYWLLSIRPRYFITEKFFTELRFDMAQELTTAYRAPLTNYSTKKHQLIIEDVSLTFKYSGLYTEPRTKITISPWARFYFPTSLESRFRDLYFASAGAFDLSKTIGSFHLTYTFSFRKYFHKYTVATLDSKKEVPIGLARTGGPEDLGGGVIAIGDNNPSFDIFNSFMASYIISDELTLSLQLALRHEFTYKSFPKDEYSSPYAEGGRGQRDYMWGVINLTYQPFKHYGFSIGISSLQPPKTKDNKSFRFPFFDFVSEANNYTSFYVDIFATY